MNLCEDCYNFYFCDNAKTNLNFTYGECDICGASGKLYKEVDLSMIDGLEELTKVLCNGRKMPVFIMINFCDDEKAKTSLSYSENKFANKGILPCSKKSLKVSGINLF